MNDTRDFGPVSGPDMAEWCDMLRDDNAIHLRRDAAQAAGFGPRRVNPGPANLAYLISALLHRDPGAGIATITAHFHGNVFEDDVLAATLSPADGAVTASLTRDGDTVLTTQFSLRGDPADD